MKQLQQTKHVLGSDGILTVVVESEAAGHALLTELWRVIDTFERRFSRFLPTSELTAFNHVSGKKTVVSPEFAALLQSMKQWSATTNGLYNPFILPALQRAGYVGSWPTPSAATAGTYYVKGVMAQGDDITIDGSEVLIPAHTAVDAGGIGKGYLLDMLATQARAADVQGFWFSLGGDIICGGTDSQQHPWRIGVQKAGSDQAVGFFRSAAQAQQNLGVATSGTIKRNGVVDGKKWHHIIDPRTNVPAKTDIVTATVCHKQATAADVLAKCLVIVGSKGAEAFCQKHHIQALLQTKDKTVHIAPERMATDVCFEPVR